MVASAMPSDATEISKLRDQVKALQEQNADLLEQLARFQRFVYGNRSEEIHSEQGTLSNEDASVFFVPEHTGDQSDQSATAAQVQEPKKSKATRKKALSKSLPIIETVIPCDDEQCPQGHVLEVAGKRFVREEVVIIPQVIYRHQIYEEVKKCATCAKQTDHTQFFQGHAPRPLIAHSLGSASMVATIAYNKYGLSLPLYRQAKEFKRAGVDLPETTYANWMTKASVVVQPVVNLIREHLVAQPFLQGDETPYKAIRDPRKSGRSHGYMWVMRSVQSSNEPGVYYAYDATRAGAFAQELYEGFSGVLQCDGYSGYNKLDDAITRTGCMAHVRRRFYDAAVHLKNGIEDSVPLKLIDTMFMLERQVQHAPAGERQAFRIKNIAPLMKKFWAWIDGLTALPKGALGRAVKYAQNQRIYLDRLMDYGEIDLSNNATERSVKDLVIGRKNYLFSTSVDGAEANANLMTLCETAKANQLDVFKYLKCLFEKLPQIPEFELNETTLAPYLPWNISLD